MIRAKYSHGISVVVKLVILLAIIMLYLLPFYFLLINSVKPLGEITKDTAALPSKLQLTNYIEAWKRTDFPRAFFNSLTVTVFSLFGVIMFSSMAAYRIVRYQSKINNLVYALCLAEMIIPFQVIMIPLVIVLDTLGLLNSLPGLIFANWGLGVALGVFMFSGFIKGVPRDLEEAAAIEGAGELRIFFRIVLPLLKSIIFTLIILDTFWFWNDYLLPSLVINQENLHTIPLRLYYFFAEYTKEWNYAMAGLVLSTAPVIVFYLFCQKYIIKGISDGAIKQ